MLKHPTLNLLQQLGLAGMAEAFTRLADNDESDNLSHAEWLALLLDHEASWRNNKRLALRLRNAKLHHPAVPEDIIRRAPREYDRSILDLLIAGDLNCQFPNFVDSWNLQLTHISPSTRITTSSVSHWHSRPDLRDTAAAAGVARRPDA